METTDFTLRPSGASRWLSCPASVLFQGAPQGDSFQTYAAEGSIAHDLLERCVLNGHHPERYLGEEVTHYDDSLAFPFTMAVNHDMVAAVNMFLTECGYWVGRGDVYAELWMQHSEVPELQGTADYIEIHKNFGYLRDLKYGKSVVQAVNRKGVVNPQLQCYAAMTFDLFEDLEFISAGIVQPRADTKQKIRTVTISRDESDEFIELVKGIRDEVEQMRTEKIDKRYEEGSHCWYCPMKKFCPERERSQLERDFK